MPPIIAISTLPRVGSMWVTNVARMLAQKSGLTVIPNATIKRDKDKLAVAEKYLGMNAENVICIIKVHMALYQKPNLKAIYVKRDLRDRIFSMCRFEKRPLTEVFALEMVTNELDMDLNYEKWLPESILRITYESLENDSKNLIRCIAEFMQLSSVSNEDIGDIDFKLSREQIKKKINQMDSVVFGDGSKFDGLSLSRVEGASGVVRAFDDATGFQSGHISDYRAGDWRHLWTDEQKKMVDDAIGATAKYRR